MESGGIPFILTRKDLSSYDIRTEQSATTIYIQSKLKFLFFSYIQFKGWTPNVQPFFRNSGLWKSVTTEFAPTTAVKPAKKSSSGRMRESNGGGLTASPAAAGPPTQSQAAVPAERDRETMDQEKRLRREIANSNERRRMQSINSGFQSLRNLLPHHEGEKLSKVRKFKKKLKRLNFETASFIHPTSLPKLPTWKDHLLNENWMKRFEPEPQYKNSPFNLSTHHPSIFHFPDRTVQRIHYFSRKTLHRIQEPVSESCTL